MRVLTYFCCALIAALSLLVIAPKSLHAATLAPRLYLLAQYKNSDQLYLGTSVGSQSPTWTPLNVAAATVDFTANGVTTLADPANPPTLFISATGPDGNPSILAYQPYTPALRNWIAIPTGANCQLQALTYLRGTLFIVCYSSHIGTPGIYGQLDIAINAYNLANGTWGGWQIVGGYLIGLHGTWYNRAVKLANDGENVFLISQTPDDTNHLQDIGEVWYTTYTFGASAVAPWRPIQTTCGTTPDAAYRVAQRAYMIACASGGTGGGGIWWNAIATGAVAQWRPFGIPAGSSGADGQGAYGGAVLATDDVTPGPTTYVAGIFSASLTANTGSNDAMLLRVTDPAAYHPGVGTDWLRLQQPQVAQLAIAVFV